MDIWLILLCVVVEVVLLMAFSVFEWDLPTRCANVVGILHAHRSGQKFGVPRVSFKEQTVVSETQNSDQYSGLLGIVVIAANPAFVAHFKLVADLALIPIEHIGIPKGDEIVAMDNDGYLLFMMPE